MGLGHDLIPGASISGGDGGVSVLTERRIAGDALFYEYYRASFFFDRADLTGSFLHSASEATKRTFRAGLDYLGVDVDPATVPYAGTTLTGYLVRPEEAAVRPYPDCGNGRWL
jgi:hypothetical protein